MARVDFYILDTPPGPESERFACRLAARAFAADHRVYVLVEDPQRAEALDELLWTFSDVSFVPHARVASPDADAAPVLIGPGSTAPAGCTVTLNLGEAAVEPAGGDERILEVIAADPVDKAAGRERYRHYQNAGHLLETHRVGSRG